MIVRFGNNDNTTGYAKVLYIDKNKDAQTGWAWVQYYSEITLAKP